MEYCFVGWLSFERKKNSEADTETVFYDWGPRAVMSVSRMVIRVFSVHPGLGLFL